VGVGYHLHGILMEMRYRRRVNGENTAWIFSVAQGEQEEKSRIESYQTYRFYHIVVPQTSNTYYLGSYSVYNTHVS
jgi:hypothetical protein